MTQHEGCRPRRLETVRSNDCTHVPAEPSGPTAAPRGWWVEGLLLSPPPHHTYKIKRGWGGGEGGGVWATGLLEGVNLLSEPT